MTIEVDEQEAEVVQCMRAVSPYGRKQVVQVARAMRVAEQWAANRGGEASDGNYYL